MARRAALALVRAPSFAPSLPLARALLPARALAIAAAVVALAAPAYVAARQTSLFALRTVEVRGATPEVRRDLAPVLQDVQGTSLVALDRTDLERRLERVPSVRDAGVDREFPHTLEVRVVSERPLAIFRDGVRAWLVAESGRVIRTVAPDARPQLPRIRVERTGTPRPGGTLGDAPTKAGLAVLRAVPHAFPASVLYAAVDEGEATLVLRDAPAIRLGLPLDLPRKLAAARAVLAAIPAEERVSVAYIDASVPERVVAGSNTQP